MWKNILTIIVCIILFVVPLAVHGKIDNSVIEITVDVVLIVLLAVMLTLFYGIPQHYDSRKRKEVIWNFCKALFVTTIIVLLYKVF